MAIATLCVLCDGHHRTPSLLICLPSVWQVQVCSGESGRNLERGPLSGYTHSTALLQTPTHTLSHGKRGPPSAKWGLCTHYLRYRKWHRIKRLRKMAGSGLVSTLPQVRPVLCIRIRSRIRVQSDPKLLAGSGVGSGINHSGSGYGQP